MTYWAGLYPPEIPGKLLDGVKTLLACVQKAMAQQPTSTLRILLAAMDEDQDEEADE